MLAPGLFDIPDHAELLRISGDHPVVRWDLSADSFTQAWAFGAAVAWIADGMRGRSLVAIGEPVDAGHLARSVLVDAASGAPQGLVSVSLPRGTLDTVRLPVGEGADWDYYWTQAPPQTRTGEERVDDLDISDPGAREDLDDLVRVSSPRASAQPGDQRVKRWMAIRDASTGQLIACAAHAERLPGVPILKTIATHPERRGEGLGADVTAAITRRAFADGAEVVTLGMYADNAPARRVYERLGFTLGAEFSSRELLPSS